MLLGAAALLWIAGGRMRASMLRGDRTAATLRGVVADDAAGNLGVFIAADLVSFYLFFTHRQPRGLWPRRA